ncbi:hypothetical protein D3C80_1507050 [compost metagenome]
MVGARYCLGFIFEGLQYQQRAEDFFLTKERAAVAMGDQRRREECTIAQFTLRATTGQQHFVTAVQCLADASLDVVPGLPIDQRPHVRRWIEAIAQADLPQCGAQRGFHFGETAGMHQHAPGGSALLARDNGGRRCQFRRDGGNIGIFKDQAAGLPAQFQRELFHGRR